MKSFMLFYRRGRRRREFEMLIDARTRQVAMKQVRRWVVGNLRWGSRIKPVFLDEVIPIPEE